MKNICERLAGRLGDRTRTGCDAGASTSGSSNVLINNRHALRVSDLIGFRGGASGEVNSGCRRVLINDLNAAGVGDPVTGICRGSVVEGSGNVMMGDWDTTSDGKLPTWVGVKLRDTSGSPMKNHRYRLRLPDGSVVAGRLDSNGEALISGIRRGSDQCFVNFPDLNPDHWDCA
jgi:uncharacterized Zn-binding protein involved in type VI secretion